ncbi:MAG: response regulator [Solirubrobacteraceae bacterium]
MTSRAGRWFSWTAPRWRELVSLLLQDAGHRVLEAPDGARALAILSDSSEAVEVMVTDMTLAGLNHAELAVGALALRPDLHVIYMSAQPEALLRTDGMPPGAFLAKPFTPQALTLAVQAAFTH